jgi:hypothetical protein
MEDVFIGALHQALFETRYHLEEDMEYSMFSTSSWG